MIAPETAARIAAESLGQTGGALHGILDRKSLKIGWLGGSVTAGFAADAFYETAFPQITAAALRERGIAVSETVCAAPGMDSMTGNLLCDAQILAQKPDLVFVEFAINEITQRPFMLAFESLLRKLLETDSAPTVCLILLRSAHDYSCESFMVPMAEHYGLPYLNLRTGLNAAIARGELDWADYGDGESHPTPDGHALIAACVMHLLEQGHAAPAVPPQPLPEPWLGVPFARMRLVIPDDAMPHENYQFDSARCISPETGAVTLDVTCTALMLFYEVHKRPEYGTVRIEADGKPIPRFHTVESYSLYGWGNPRYVPVILPAARAAHSVRIIPERGQFYLLALGLCD